jgi:hypothetical protein
MTRIAVLVRVGVETGLRRPLVASALGYKQQRIAPAVIVLKLVAFDTAATRSNQASRSGADRCRVCPKPTGRPGDSTDRIVARSRRERQSRRARSSCSWLPGLGESSHGWTAIGQPVGDCFDRSATYSSG